ncbi:MAG: biotin--[acetyl-CoA-carboxylase] ligase, partial [Anaerolineae bacterium]|nr:biotin--[acetyl-CoA-carboxylase] ligase [Phycisphaerae bacterium]
WPNDVFVNGAKVSGIMLDSGSLQCGQTWVALAFGVNLADSPENIDQATISLRDLLPPDAPAPEPLAFLASLRPRLGEWSARIITDGFDPLRRAWLQRAYGMGQEARVVQGEITLEGRIAGLSPRGELELDTVSGRRLIAAGDVFLSKAA